MGIGAGFIMAMGAGLIYIGTGVRFRYWDQLRLSFRFVALGPGSFKFGFKFRVWAILGSRFPCM